MKKFTSFSRCHKETFYLKKATCCFWAPLERQNLPLQKVCHHFNRMMSGKDITKHMINRNIRIVQEIGLRTWLTEIQQSDWSVAVVLNSIDHAVEKHFPKTIETVVY